MRLFHFSLLFTFIAGLNTSEEGHDPSHIPRTVSNSDLTSSSRDVSPGPNLLPDVFRVGNAHTLGTTIPGRGGEFSGSGDKTKLHVVPQESQHNGQEKAGSVISALAHAVTFTETEQDSSLSSAGTQWPERSTRTLPTATGAYSNTNRLSEHATRTSKTPLDTPSDRSDAPDALSQSFDSTVMSSAPSHLTTFENKASVSGFDLHASLISSSTPDETADRSRGTSRTDLVPPLKHLYNNDMYEAITSEADVVRTSAYTDTSRPNHLHRATRISGDVSNRTPTSLSDDLSTVTSPVSRFIDMSTLSVFRSDASDYVTTVSQKRAESSSYTPMFYTHFSKTYSTPTATPASHTTFTKYTTAHEQTSNLHVSDSDTQHTSSRLGESRTTSGTSMGWDFTSYPPNTPGQDDPLISTSLHTSFFPSTTKESDPTMTHSGLTTSPADTRGHLGAETQSGHLMASTRTSEQNSTSHVSTHSTESSPTTFSRYTSSTSGDDTPSPTTPNPSPSQRLTSPSTHVYSTQTSLLQMTTQILNRLTTSANVQPHQTPPQVYTNTRSQPGEHTPPSPTITPTSSHRMLTTKPAKHWSHRGRIFITEDQPVIVNVETFQVLLQVILEKNSSSYAGLVEVAPFLQAVAGFQSQHVTWRRCPVGEDFWFMGQRCDLRMTRQRLAGVCFGVLAAIAVLMGLLAFLAVQRFKKMLIQAKAEQTQSSYRRFNHFDELSARFWRRSWPGSENSLDNTAFSRSDELLHMRAMDRACCYHDDTLSIASTYPDSVTHLNTVYPNSSQYHWDMSTCSLADGVIDSGKASDLSVCSWPIEPIQWTPFPLLQQLRNSNTMKPPRPLSCCEGMELVGLEKSRTA
ncbi:flocculation protein FLO11 [Silurus meridionalis]|nr:flocculation protein FLO11 [Silurus meridionalis]